MILLKKLQDGVVMKVEKMFDIVALGEVLIDFTFQGYNDDGQRLFAQNAGGAPANVLVSISKLGGTCAFLGKVGDDMHGNFLKETLQNNHVNTGGLVIDEKYFTTFAFVSLSASGERSFSFARKSGADTKITKEEIKTDLIKEAKIFHVGSLSMTDEPSRAATLFAIKFAKENGLIISYDPNYRASLWKNEKSAKKYMRSLLPFVDVMKISDEETELLTGISDVEKSAKALFDKGIKVVVVTLGEKGAYVYGEDGGTFVKPFDCKVVDTTGAGDAFWGGFLYKISKFDKKIEEFSKSELIDFAKFGNATASLCVEKRGAIPAMPSLDEVNARLKID